MSLPAIAKHLKVLERAGLVARSRDVWPLLALEVRAQGAAVGCLGVKAGPRRTAQIVVRQEAKQASPIRWSVGRSPASASATTSRRNARREPELPL